MCTDMGGSGKSSAVCQAKRASGLRTVYLTQRAFTNDGNRGKHTILSDCIPQTYSLASALSRGAAESP
jgi:hypothetical protein